MRKISILLLAVFTLFTFSLQLLKANDSGNSGNTSNSEITLTKETVTGPLKAPSQNPVSFQAYIADGVLSVHAINYSSTVQIEIIGPDVLSQSFNYAVSTTALMDLSYLTEGEYLIRIITNGNGGYTGCFSL